MYSSPVHNARKFYPPPPFPNNSRRAPRRGGVFLALLLTLITLLPHQAVQAQGSVPAKVTSDIGTGDREVTVYWTDPDDASITKWQYRYAYVGRAYSGWIDVPNSYSRTYSHTITGLPRNALIFVQVRAVNANGAGTESNATSSAMGSKTITLSTSSPIIAEGNSGLTNVVITVTLSEPAPVGGQYVSIVAMNRISTASGYNNIAIRACSSRQPGDDICGPAGITIPAGATSGDYTFSVVGDTTDEANETMYFKAFPNGWARGTLRIVIADDEGGAATATPTSHSYTGTHRHTGPAHGYPHAHSYTGTHRHTGPAHGYPHAHSYTGTHRHTSPAHGYPHAHSYTGTHRHAGPAHGYPHAHSYTGTHRHTSPAHRYLHPYTGTDHRHTDRNTAFRGHASLSTGRHPHTRANAHPSQLPPF